MRKPVRTEQGVASAETAHRSVGATRVWDPLVRVLHWTLALSVAIAWFTAHSAEEAHLWAGYYAAAVVVVRVSWGFLGTPHARFSDFVRSPATVARYLHAIVRGREARYIGHNPAGGAMVLALMAAIAATAVTGWMMTTDAYFGVPWVAAAHDLIAHGLLLLVFVHVCGVALASIRHRESLIGAMITGRKRA
jgi:cytochrome b